MNRTDSGFDESLCTKVKPLIEQRSLQRTNSEPTRRHKSEKTTRGISSPHHVTNSSNQRPSPDKKDQSSRSRKSTDTRRQSLGSSSEHSTAKSRRHGHSSKPSSRRTSVTYVDPSRPMRNYRIRSSQTVPTTCRDIDDVLALHFRSCSLFQNPSYQTDTSLAGHRNHDAIVRCAQPITFSNATPELGTQGIQTIDADQTSKQSEDALSTTEPPKTVMHWTSPSTRRREYEKIDRSNSGIRAFLRQIVPRCVSGPPPPKFYDEEKSDVSSVRRYRMDLPEANEEDAETDEKSTASLRARKSKSTKKKAWSCF